jgi:hypothetical protein
MKENTSDSQTRVPELVTGEPTNIRIYQEAHAGKARHLVSYHDSQRRRRRHRSHPRIGPPACRPHQEGNQAGGWDAISLRGSEKPAYEQAMEVLRPMGISLDLVALQLAEASQVLKGHSLADAARATLWLQLWEPPQWPRCRSSGTIGRRSQAARNTDAMSRWARRGECRAPQKAVAPTARRLSAPGSVSNRLHRLRNPLPQSMWISRGLNCRGAGNGLANPRPRTLVCPAARPVAAASG